MLIFRGDTVFIYFPTSWRFIKYIVTAPPEKNNLCVRVATSIYHQHKTPTSPLLRSNRLIIFRDNRFIITRYIPHQQTNMSNLDHLQKRCEKKKTCHDVLWIYRAISDETPKITNKTSWRFFSPFQIRWSCRKSWKSWVVKPNLFSPHLPPHSWSFSHTHGISLSGQTAPVAGDFPSYQRIPRRAVSPSFLVVPPYGKGGHFCVAHLKRNKIRLCLRSAELGKHLR